MQAPVIMQQSENIPSLPLNEAAWHAWQLKGRAQEERSRAAFAKAVKWISLVGLLLAAAAGSWARLAPYEIVVRFLVAAGALLLMSQAFHTRRFAIGTVFGTLALLYNPVAPLFSFSGEWQRALVAASAVPFIASLTWRNAKLAANV